MACESRRGKVSGWAIEREQERHLQLQSSLGIPVAKGANPNQLTVDGEREPGCLGQQRPLDAPLLFVQPLRLCSLVDGLTMKKMGTLKTFPMVLARVYPFEGRRRLQKQEHETKKGDQGKGG